MKFERRQHDEYLAMTERVGSHWLKVFSDDDEFWSASYWDLFTKLWKARGEVRKTDALRYMHAIKSPHTAGKYLDSAIQKGLVDERENPTDARSKLVRLSPTLQRRLDEFFDAAVEEMRRSAELATRKEPPSVRR